MTFDPSALTTQDLQQLRQFLAEADYTTGTLAEILGIPGGERLLADVARTSLLHADYLGSSPAATLGKLFLLCAATPKSTLHGLPRQLLTFLYEHDLVEIDADTMCAFGKVTMSEIRGYIYMADRLFENRFGEITVPSHQDICMPPHASSFELMRAITRTPRRASVLDIGCGSGCLALPLARSGCAVTAIDICGRAVAFAQANAILNDVAARFEHASWIDFQPSQRYEHIVFNSPDAATAFEFLTAGMPRLLAPGGLAQVWLTCEVLAEDDGVDGTIAREIGTGSFAWTAEPNDGSPFSLGRAAVESGKRPQNTLLVTNPSEWRGYVRSLRDRGVAEVASVVIQVGHRLPGRG